MAKFTTGVPATSSSQTSQPVRDNLHALFTMDFGSLRVRARSTPDMTVDVDSDYSVAYVQHRTPMNYAGGTSPTLSAPGGNNRLSLLTIDRDGTLAWTSGSEALSPAEPTFPAGKIPLAVVWCRPGMTSIKNTDDSVNGFVYLDRRPFLSAGNGIAIDNKDFTNSTSTSVGETALYSGSIEGGLLGTDNAYRVHVTGAMSITAATTGQITFRFKYGGTTLVALIAYAATTAAIGSHDWSAEIFLNAENSASAQTMCVRMTLNSNAQATNFMTFDSGLTKDSSVVGVGTAAINSATDQFLTVTCEDTSGASSARSISVTNVYAEAMR
jgi:hypothetical protein